MVTFTLTRRHKLIGLTLLAVAFAMVLAALGLELAYAERIPPRIKIGNVSLGGKSRDQAKAALDQAVNEFREREVALQLNDQRWPVSASALNVQFEVDKTIGELFGSGSRLRYLMSGPKARLKISFDQAKLEEYFEKIAKVTDDPSADASLKITDTEIVELPEKIGKGFDRELARSELEGRFARLNTDPITLIIKTIEPKVYQQGLTNAKKTALQLLSQTLVAKAVGQQYQVDRDEVANFIVFEPSDEPVFEGKGKPLAAKLSDDKIRDWVKKIAKRVDQPLKDARLKLEGERVTVFAASQEGRTIDKDKTVELVKSKLLHGQDSLELPVAVKKPAVTTESVNDLGIKELIGKGTTSFKGSPQNRKHNIGNGSRFLNGILIRPGEVFSTVEQLGQIDDTTGYLPELVIKENKTIPEFGGGLCQVSTTLFRAALNSGLPIVERQNHSWRIRYYEPPVGLDATVYLPKPDLKIKNDTPGWVLIQGFVQGDNLTFEFYGTKDGRRAELIGPKLLSSTPPPAAEYIDSADLPEGETKQVEKPHPGGKATVTYRVYDKDGKLINDQTFNSSYKPVPARFLKGTGPKPAPEPAPTEASGQAPSPSPEPTPSPSPSPEPTPTPAASQ